MVVRLGLVRFKGEIPCAKRDPKEAKSNRATHLAVEEWRRVEIIFWWKLSETERRQSWEPTTQKSAIQDTWLY